MESSKNPLDLPLESPTNESGDGINGNLVEGIFPPNSDGAIERLGEVVKVVDDRE
jgi:hypothetical protein